MVQLEIQGKNGRGVTRQVVISCKESDIDSSERLFKVSTTAKSVGSVLTLSQRQRAGVVGAGSV